MKKHSFFLLFILTTTLIRAQLITVDNFNPGADFTDLQEAIDSSSNGDTIYVAGSNVSYGNIIVNKTLTIFGNGYDNTTTSTKSQLGALNFQNGCHLSHISGFEMNNAYLSQSYTTNTDSITLSDNKANYIQLQRGSHHLIEGNLLLQTSWCLSLGVNTSNTFCTNTIARSNIFYSPIIYTVSNTNLIENNVFFRANVNHTHDPFFYNNYCQNTIVINNIFFGSSQGITESDCLNCSFSFNSYYSHDGTNYVGDNPLFMHPDTLATNNVTLFDTSHDVNLQVGSPAINAGQNGFDLGATGGVAPFFYGGFAPIPRVTSITSPSTTVEAGGTIQVTIQAISQQ